MASSRATLFSILPMTSNPTPHERDESDFDARTRVSPAMLETLLRYDEASSDELALLEREPGVKAVLRTLRAADAYLESGGLLSSERKRELAAAGSASESAEALFDYGRGDLSGSAAERVREHLAQTPVESAWVESLRSSPPPATLTWDGIDADIDEDIDKDIDGGIHDRGESTAQSAPQGTLQPEVEASDAPPVLRMADARGAKPPFPGWLAWTPLAAAALILAMAIGGTGQRTVLDGGLPNSPIMRSASTDALLFPRGRIIGSTASVRTYASRPLFEVTPVAGATQYGFELREVTGQNVFAEGEAIWRSSSPSHQASAPQLVPGKYTWTATATVQGIDRDLGSLSFTVLPARSVDRGLLVRAAESLGGTMPAILREDIRRLHASGFLTDARSKARALPPGDERDRYLGLRSSR